MIISNIAKHQNHQGLTITEAIQFMASKGKVDHTEAPEARLPAQQPDLLKAISTQKLQNINALFTHFIGHEYVSIDSLMELTNVNSLQQFDTIMNCFTSSEIIDCFSANLVRMAQIETPFDAIKHIIRNVPRAGVDSTAAMLNMSPLEVQQCIHEATSGSFRELAQNILNESRQQYGSSTRLTRSSI